MSVAAPSASVSPFLAQYLAIKAEHPEALLFFRMGDFYELFFEDAAIAAETLGIALTRRGEHEGKPIPMAGVPWHQAEGHLAKLIRAGLKVAICEQMEDPAEARKRGSKSIVRREVVRVVTPGTITEEGLLDPRAALRLAAVVVIGEEAGLAVAEIASGALETRAVALSALAEALAAAPPAELLASEADARRPEIAMAATLSGAALSTRPAIKGDPRAGERRALAVFGVATLDAFGAFTQAERAALGLLLDYIELTQAGAAPRLSPPVRASAGAGLALDPATRAALEIERTVRGERAGALLAAIDRTVTAAGSRLLAERLARPLTDLAAIEARLDAVAWFVDAPGRRTDVRRTLLAAPDLARALGRLDLGRGQPRDLAALRDGLRIGEDAAARVASPGEAPPALLASALQRLSSAGEPALAALWADLARSLAADLPALARDGGVFAVGCDGALDAARSLRDDSRHVLAGLEAEYREQSSQPLKLRHNGVLGYHLECSPRQAEALLRPPLSETFRHRQTTATAVRFTTKALEDLDARIARAAEEALAREAALFQGFVEQARALAGPIRAAAAALAELDVATALAEHAAEAEAVRPELDEGSALVAEGLRHPVVEASVRKAGGAFTPNDVRLDADGRIGPRLIFITGPNMAGKSTYLRQVALACILAQAGCYVPARRFRLGVVDRVFSRIGASDDLARGRSTFMMEMVETAAILHQAGPRTLVILDEIGRGTATYDGLAIAWAAAEHLHDVNRCRALFATHYHELTGLAQKLAAAANAHLRAREWQGDLVFLHELAPGPADRSYGVAVAKLAGAPKRVVERARAILAKLETGQGLRGAGLLEELPLFADAQPAPLGEPSSVEAALAAIDPDALSPKEALEALYRLKSLASSG